ncbi:hypothetical protein Tco_0323209 [Tanacetum coccineum]
MKGYLKQLECVGYVLPQDLSVGLIMNGLTGDFAGFGLPKKVATPQVMAIQGGKIHKANKKSLNAKGKGKGKGKGKDKPFYIPKPKNPKPSAKEHLTKDDACHHCKEDYAIESAIRILNMVPTKKVGYPKETMGYYFYFPPENKIVVARYAEFLEKNLISQEVSGRAVELEKIQAEDISPFKNTSEITAEVEAFEPPQEEVVLIRMSERTHRAPERLCLNVEVEEDSLRDLNEPINYKTALLYLESNKWIDVINAEIQSMKDNQVWCLVDLPPNAKGFTQTYGVDYEETFLPVADIRAIRILIAIGEVAIILGIKIYRDRSKGLFRLSQSSYMDKILKIFKMDNSKRGNILMQERLDLNKTQGASTPEEAKRMQNVPYALAVGSIMYAVRCTRPNVACLKT